MLMDFSNCRKFLENSKEERKYDLSKYRFLRDLKKKNVTCFSVNFSIPVHPIAMGLKQNDGSGVSLGGTKKNEKRIFTGSLKNWENVKKKIIDVQFFLMFAPEAKLTYRTLRNER